MKKRVCCGCLVLFCASLLSTAAFAQQTGGVWANRTLLPPGADYSFMQRQAGGAALLDVTYTKGETLTYFTAGGSSPVRLYLKTSTADSLDVTVRDALQTELARLYMVPRTYFTYDVYGLAPGEPYQLRINAESGGSLLVY